MYQYLILFIALKKLVLHVGKQAISFSLIIYFVYFEHTLYISFKFSLYRYYFFYYNLNRLIISVNKVLNLLTLALCSTTL